MNPYNILGIDPISTLEEIRYKYKSLAQLHHPDKGGDEETFKNIKLAYEILSDPKKRKEFDETGQVKFSKPIYDEAVEQLSQMFQTFMDQHDPSSHDIIELLKVITHNSRTHIYDEIPLIKSKIYNQEFIINNVKNRYNLTKNLFHEFANHDLKCLQEDYELKIRKIKVYDKIEQILNEYYCGSEMIENSIECQDDSTHPHHPTDL